MLVPCDAEVAYLAAEDSIACLHRSGWHLSVMVYTDGFGQTLWEIAGRQGENRIKVEAESRREVWHKAVLAAASCGMLQGWPKPSRGS